MNPSMKTRRVFATIVICWGGAIGFARAIADTPLFVGVLEDVKPGSLSPAMSSAHVRVAFQKRGAEWVSLKTDFNNPTALAESYKYYPDAVHWTVALHGKRIGTIESKNPGAPSAYGDVGTQTITTDRSLIPKISSGAADFSHFDNPANTRPLILVSANNFKDPDGWKSTTLSEVEKKEAIKNFRNRFPSLEQCDEPEQKPIHLVPYLDKEILFIQAFRSASGEIMFGQRLDDKRSNCGFFDDKLFFDYWFVRFDNENFQLLGSQMMPMDAVDLDANGSSEWIFQTERGEDQDGYELFYDHFGKKTSFQWTYH
jgi:hypothetical protein